MSTVIFQIKKGAPTSYTISQREVMAEKPETGEFKYIGYYRGQDTIFVEDIDNSDLRPTKVPPFTFNPTRNKCELRFDDRDKALYTYIMSHPNYEKTYELYSEEIESEKTLGKANAIEKAFEYIKESDALKIRALGLAVLGLSTYNKPVSTISAKLKDKAINKPKEIILACEDELFENRFIASLALCSGIVKTNNTMTAIVWADNNGRLINIATGEDFITKFAKHLGEKNPENQSLLQELGTRLALNKKEKTSRSAEADEIAKLKAQLAAANLDKEIAEGKLLKEEKQVEKQVNTEPTPEDLALMELRGFYKEVLGKNVPFRYQNDADWMHKKIDVAQKEN